MSKCAVILAALGLALSAEAQTAARPGRQQDPAVLEAINRGKTQFQKSCGFCHGVNGDGGAEGPSLIRSGLVRHDEHGEQIGPVIHEGRPERGMPAIPLTPAQTSDVVAFLHERLRVLDRTSPGRPSNDRYSLNVLLTGNAEAGKAYFNGEGRCATCHSPTGDLAGIAAKYPPVDLQTRMLYPVGKQPTAVVTSASGAKTQGTLVRMDDFSISIRDADGWQHTWPRSSVKVEVQDPLAAHKQQLASAMTNAHMHDLFAYLETLK